MRFNWRGLKTGEKILYGIFGVFMVMAVIGFAAMEWVRLHMDKPMYASTTHYDFSAEGLRGSEIFRFKNCTACHRALRNGTNMGLDLDGRGSRYSYDYFYNFLKNPEKTYREHTVDHGLAPKEAAWVADLPDADLRALARFVSELKADQGSGSAVKPPSEKSSFIDNMLKLWAPDTWKTQYKDVRGQKKPDDQEGHRDAGH
jgi:hypothetical protein